jgi:hypothetical protein
MERFLLLWDELDDLAGATRHWVLNTGVGMADAGRDALGQLGRLGALVGRPRARLADSQGP